MSGNKYQEIEASVLDLLHKSISSKIEINNCIELIQLLQVESRSIFKSKVNDLKNSDSSEYLKIGNRYTILNIQTINYFANNQNDLIYLTAQLNKNGEFYLTLNTEYHKTLPCKNGYEIDIPLQINHINGNPRDNNYKNLQITTDECHKDIHKTEYFTSLRGD